MELKDIIRAPKDGISLGDWKQGRIRYTDFPVAKAPSRAFRYGPAYRWRVIGFDALGVRCRVLVLFNYTRSIFRATLGVERQDGLVLICDHEYHATEPGWHCHVSKEAVEDVPTGLRRFHMRKWPRRPAASRRGNVTSETEAFEKAMSFYRIHNGQGPGIFP